MAAINLQWNKFADKYKIYKAENCNEEYKEIATINSVGELETFSYEKDYAPHTFNGLWLQNKLLININKGQMQDTFKIIPCNIDGVPLSTPSLNVLHFNDKTHLKSTGVGTELNVNLSQAIQNRFIVINIEVPKLHTPDQIIITIHTINGDKSGYMGAQVAPLGNLYGTNLMYNFGEIPTNNCLVPIIIDRNLLSLGNVTGFSFQILQNEANPYKEQPELIIDSIYSTNDFIVAHTGRHIGTSRYLVYRKTHENNNYIYRGSFESNEFEDLDVYDIRVNRNSNIPTISASINREATEIILEWSNELSSGTLYTYKIIAVDDFNRMYDPALHDVSINSDYYSVVLEYGTSPDDLSYLASGVMNKYVHKNLSPAEYHYYRVSFYNSEGELKASKDMSIYTEPSSVFDYFYLDYSSLS